MSVSSLAPASCRGLFLRVCRVARQCWIVREGEIEEREVRGRKGEGGGQRDEREEGGWEEERSGGRGEISVWERSANPHAGSPDEVSALAQTSLPPALCVPQPGANTPEGRTRLSQFRCIPRQIKSSSKLRKKWRNRKPRASASLAPPPAPSRTSATLAASGAKLACIVLLFLFGVALSQREGVSGRERERAGEASKHEREREVRPKLVGLLRPCKRGQSSWNESGRY